MLTIRRTVRLCINPGADPDAPPTPPTGDNAYAGTPAMQGLGRYYEFDITCLGEPDPDTGYLVDIKIIDRAVRAAIYPPLAHACAKQPTADPAALLPDLAAHLADALAPHRLSAIRWRLTPTYALALEGLDMPVPTSTPARPVLIRQRFDFAAAHRLHVQGLSDEENRAMFGKCNNPSGHGHNYQLEPCVALPASGEHRLSLPELERLVDETVIARFDHRHLNVDTSDFASEGGVNPSVENIARVAFDLLRALVAERGGDLRTVTVWETDRTSATYPA